MNWRLASVLFTIVSTVAMGVLLTLSLILGYDSTVAIVLAVLSGLLLAVPVTYLVTKRLLALAVSEPQ
ncbi:MAG: hypothetical protein WA154_05275 [Moraxellaceae bacterium]